MAAVGPVPWQPSPALAPAGLLAATSPYGNPEPQTLPFLPPPPPAILPPRAPIVLQLHPHPGFLADVDRRRSCSLLQVSFAPEVLQSWSVALTIPTGFFPVI